MTVKKLAITAVGALSLISASSVTTAEQNTSREMARGSRPDLILGSLVQISGTSPFGSLDQCGDFPGTVGDPGVNFLNSEVEPWVDVNPTNPNNIVAFWQQDRWSNGGSRGLVAGVSQDGGGTWRTVVVPGITDCSGGSFERATDPWLSFSPDGTLHQVSLAFNVDPPADRPALFGPSALLVSKSADGGLTWTDPITVIQDTDPRFFSDKQSITADSQNASLVYVVWDRLENLNDLGTSFKGPAYFARTVDGGDTWEPARVVYDPGVNNQVIGAQLLVARDGRLLYFFNEIVNVREDGTINRFASNLAFIESTDKGQTWSAVRRIDRILSTGAITPKLGVPVRDADILFDVAVDPRNGFLYAVWQDARFNSAEYDAVAFSMSRDGGRTWSDAIKINPTLTTVAPARQQAFIPSVAVGRDGTVIVTYYDFRNDSNVEAELTDHFVASCRNNCTNPRRWRGDSRLTDASFDILQAPFANGLFLGDYVGLASDGNDALPVFGQSLSPEDPASLYFRRIQVRN